MCKLCGSRHALSEPHVWKRASDLVEPEALPIKVADQTPIKAKVEIKKIASVAPRRGKEDVAYGKIAAGLRDAIDWSQCPNCRSRIAKQVEANRRYREKRRG